MSATQIETKSLKLVPQTREQRLAAVVQMKPHEKAGLSPAWLALLESSGPMDPWIRGFELVQRASSEAVGSCGFKAPPGPDGVVEIAYAVGPELV
jgi:hypothetical protein